MVNVLAGPAQPIDPLVKVGVTVMVATTGMVPGLMAVKDGMLPVPEAARPIDGVELIQE